MIDLFQKIEGAIRKVSDNAMDLSSLQGNLDVVLKALTVDKNDYESPVLYEIPDEHSRDFKVLASQNDIENLTAFSEKYGHRCTESESQACTSAILLYFQSQFGMAQTIADRLYADRLRTRIYPRVLQGIQENAYREKLKEAAKKPRNQHYDEAVKIMSRTWEKYPGASKKAMCEKMRVHFDGRVSVDTLERWIKKEKIQPLSKTQRTSFTLVL